MPETSDFISTDMLNGSTGNCNWEGQQTLFQHDIPIEINTAMTRDSGIEILFRIRFRADQDFGTQNNPDPRVGPMTYVNNLRLIEEYTEQIHGRTITNVPRLYSIILNPSGKLLIFYFHKLFLN